MAFGNRTTFGQARPAMPVQPPRSSTIAQPDAQQSAPFDIGRVVSRAFGTLAHNAVTFLALVAAAAAPERLAYHFLPMDKLMMIPMLTGITGLSRMALLAAATKAALSDFRGEPVQFGRCLEAAVICYFPVFAITLLGTLGIAAASLLLIVPGVILALAWSVTVPVRIAEGKSIFAAFTRSRSLSKGYRWQILALWLMLLLLGSGIALAMLPVWGMPRIALPAFVMGNWLFTLLLALLTAIGSASIYYELCLAKEGGMQSDVAEAFD
jgi:hypothetical protein